jgi:uncharacterized protein GlcG (DUF336 family)
MLRSRWTVLALVPVVVGIALLAPLTAQEDRGEKAPSGPKGKPGPKEASPAMKPVTLDAAQTVLKAARMKAEQLHVRMNIAVVDDGANLVAFARMDGAWLGSIEIAQNKAYTARAFDLSTKELAAKSQPGKPLFGISHGGRIVIFAGGIPLKADGHVVGAIGVSGGTPDQDHEVAQAGAASFVPGGKTGEPRDRTDQ